MYEVIYDCVFCGKTNSVKVPEDGYFAWAFEGVLIQNAMPEVSATDREALISNICPCCQHKVFGEEDA